MANININVAEKPLINFAPVSVLLLRNDNNFKNVDLGYSNGTGQQMTAGQVLYVNGNPSGTDYTQIKVLSNTIISGTGTIPIEVSAYPPSTQQNQVVQPIFDSSTMTFNLTYNTRLETSYLGIVMDNRVTRNFIASDFINKFTAYDGNTLDSISITGNVANYQYDINGTNNYVPYVAGTWVPVGNIFRLRFVSPDQDDYYAQLSNWAGKDNMGNIANPSTIAMAANSFVPSPVQYNSHSVGVATLCNNPEYDKVTKFNDTLGNVDFVVGYQYSNSAGYPAQTLRIENYTDENFFEHNTTGQRIPTSGFVAKHLRNSSTNTLITTFPYDIPITNVGQITVELGGYGLKCDPNPDPANYTAKHFRTMYFRIIDSNGNQGPIKESTSFSFP